MPVALTATIYNFDVQLSDVDRGVYESLSLRAARQPSETEEYLATRVLAYCLEYAEGIAFTKGLAEPDVPAVEVRDLTGALKSWIEVGAPDADRLHKASKASPRVVVYTFKDPSNLIRQIGGERIHRVEALEIYAFEPEFIAAFVSHLNRRTTFDLAVTDRHLYLTIDGDALDTALKPVEVAERRSG
ncbi:MAG TPA: YaeQ family protein [Gemmatimonadaceae bacterium]|nr:YaeQ family protein [Gemmatimonadaceae bacterium]